MTSININGVNVMVSDSDRKHRGFLVSTPTFSNQYLMERHVSHRESRAISGKLETTFIHDELATPWIFDPVAEYCK